MTVLERLTKRTASVAVIGFGRVGLPLGIALARAGLQVLGVDHDPVRRKSIEAAKMPFHEPGCDEALAEVVANGRLSVHESAADAVPKAHVVVLCVGTPLGGDLRPDYADLRAALADIGPHLKTGQLLIQRSTVSPGTLHKVLLRSVHEHAPDVAPSLLVAACPERIAEGRALDELGTLPEIVGGIDAPSTDAAEALFRLLGKDKHIHRTDPMSAELAKLFTNVYRYVTFALSNEFAMLGEYYGVDTTSIIAMANEGYPRAAIPRPGPAGGPCLSKDGYFLVEELNLPDFVLLAWKLNDGVPAHAVRRLGEALGRRDRGLAGARVAVLGQTFKRDSDDFRQSPAVRVTEILNREGAKVLSHDPHLPGLDLESALSGAHAFILATNHSEYDRLEPKRVAALMEPPRVAVDCWGVLDVDAFDRAGIEMVRLGSGVRR
jgi:UDP-N-acetyl-D-mannosaminuronic acid dehydrogenase